jgi:hypothetical protein
MDQSRQSLEELVEYDSCGYSTLDAPCSQVTQTNMPALPFFAWAHRLVKNVRVFSLAAQEEIFSKVKVDG